MNDPVLVCLSRKLFSELTTIYTWICFSFPLSRKTCAVQSVAKRTGGMYQPLTVSMANDVVSPASLNARSLYLPASVCIMSKIVNAKCGDDVWRLRREVWFTLTSSLNLAREKAHDKSNNKVIVKELSYVSSSEHNSFVQCRMRGTSPRKTSLLFQLSIFLKKS